MEHLVSFDKWKYSYVRQMLYPKLKKSALLIVYVGK